MEMVEIIEKKRDGAALTEAQLRYFIREYTAGNIPDYQAAAWLMAVRLRGMTAEETAILTDAMAHSGDMVDLSCLGEGTVDKHSTGGVGDKTSLIVAPLAASLGCQVAKMSGRGLGHTGGTVDKLAAIPGYRTELSMDAFLQQVRQVGVAIVGQTGSLAPADKKLYALRDVTATVDSIPLITASIMSKKLAAGSKNIVLDVKVGSGAFMKTVDEARQLAQWMVNIGARCGRRMTAVLTDMDRPLGRAVGNALEVQEAVSVLRGDADAPEDLRQISLLLAAEMVALVQRIPQEKAMNLAKQALESGAAYEKMHAWIVAQGGDKSCLENRSGFPKASLIQPVCAAASGFITSMDTESVGHAAMLLGAGRKHKDDPVDSAAGIYLLKKTGEPVERGEPIATLYTDRRASLQEASACLLSAISYDTQPPLRVPLAYDTIYGDVHRGGTYHDAIPCE